MFGPCADHIRRLASRFPFEIKGTKPDRVWINELLTSVGLDGFGARSPRELSGGMQRRAARVRALSFKPSVLLMGEPFGALDSFTRDAADKGLPRRHGEAHGMGRP
jgi:NitT/TauT family transport system ATP-binding protein